jgi:hypothetical protein
MPGLGIIIVGTAILVLLGWGCRGFFVNPDVHLALRVVVGAIGVGVLIIVIRVVKDRLARMKAAKFKEVKK